MELSYCNRDTIWNLVMVKQRKYMELYGAVLCVTGDVPASNFLGGFKEGVGFALRKCHMCLATQSDMSTKVYIV